MLKLSEGKKEALERLSTEEGIIEVLAIDQRGSLKKMMAAFGESNVEKEIINFKIVASEELTKYASAILLDPEYGLPAAKRRSAGSGLLLAYEKTGYDVSTPGRMPDILEDWSVRRLKEEGADAIKFLLYYNPDDDKRINHLKHVFVERLGSECLGEDIPFFLELVTYDTEIDSTHPADYARIKPRKVIESTKEFAKPQYHADVLKLEVPVDMNYVEGFSDEEMIYSRKEALSYFEDQSDAANQPFIFLSAGVTMQLFQETIKFAKEAGSTFSGVLCGRATWRDGVKPYITQGKTAGLDWFATQGRNNIETLNEVVEQSAVSWRDRVE
ncbi:tagatose-bisphosphate aldolase [Enterococcus sp. BWB1-3]|uniref:tagatose-bisphosphate aldolase n=1 Tax=Enterococcus sp. BWB1-3 TaxID=2787713 RepID=UPI001923CB60|nr:tagatose-bisphosphate aldolase [Enterococcus sp. BWB1-3]MBL1228665.1 tagatose-bisphosphate aldolase [Enterococcus sp. BWB1-3]